MAEDDKFPAFQPITPVPMPLSSERVDRFMQTLPPPEFTELQQLLMTKAVVLQGILFSMHFHGDDLLKTQAPNLSEEIFNRLKNRLEDQLTAIDRKHQQREGHGASTWEAMGTRIDSEKLELDDDENRTRSIRIRMFPRAFSNKLAAMKDRLVEARLDKCITLESYRSGRYKECIYILPYSNAPFMIALVDAVNKEIDLLNEEIAEYVESSDYLSLYRILKEFNLTRIVDKKTWHIPHVMYKAIPLALNPAAVMTMVKAGRTTLDEKLKKEYEVGEKLLQEELERQSREMVTGALTALKKQIDDSVSKIVLAMKTDPERVKADLENLKNKAASIGLEALANSVIDPLQALIDNPDKVGELFGVKVLSQVPDEVDERIKALLRSL